MHIKTIENLAQHFNIVNIISDVIKNAIYRQTRTFNKSFSEKKHDTASQLPKEYANRNWSRR